MDYQEKDWKGGSCRDSERPHRLEECPSVFPRRSRANEPGEGQGLGDKLIGRSARASLHEWPDRDPASGESDASANVFLTGNPPAKKNASLLLFLFSRPRFSHATHSRVDGQPSPVARAPRTVHELHARTERRWRMAPSETGCLDNTSSQVFLVTEHTRCLTPSLSLDVSARPSQISCVSASQRAATRRLVVVSQATETDLGRLSLLRLCKNRLSSRPSWAK